MLPDTNYLTNTRTVTLSPFVADFAEKKKHTPSRGRTTTTTATATTQRRIIIQLQVPPQIKSPASFAAEEFIHNKHAHTHTP